MISSLHNTRKRFAGMALASCIGLFGAAASHAAGDIEALQKKSPNNWGKWGKEDQIGGLNYLDGKQVLRGVAEIKTGERFTLQLPMTHGVGPVFPGRVPVMHFMSQDESIYSSNKINELPGGVKYSDDAVFMYLQGTTHVDALGHAFTHPITNANADPPVTQVITHRPFPGKLREPSLAELAHGLMQGAD